MGRLLRLLLGTMARGLRAIAGRLAPVETLDVAPALPVGEPSGGPPGHWLEMVRTRAPGLHLSLQERGVVATLRPPARLPVPPPTATVMGAAARQASSAERAVAPPAGAAAASPSTRLPPARPVAAGGAPVPRAVVPPSDVQLPAWESAAVEIDQEDWTRVPGRHAAPALSSPQMTVPALSRDDADDAVAAVIVEIAAAALPRAESNAEGVPTPTLGDEPPRASSPPLSSVAVEPVWQRPAGPGSAPARAEERGFRRPLPGPSSHPAPLPAPWRSEAQPTEMAAGLTPRFPPLPDEEPVEVPRRGGPAPFSSAASPIAPSWTAAMCRHHDASGAVGALSSMPATQIPSWQAASQAAPGPLPTPMSEADRWPALPGDETAEGDDPDLSLPCGHRERLEREQRGLAWNG